MNAICALLVLLPLVAAQEEGFYRCDCAFFAQSQIDDDYFGDQAPAGLYGTFTHMDPYVCTFPEGGINPCKEWCQAWAEAEISDGWNYCTETPETINERCYGGLFCETLYTEGHTEINDEAVRLFYRMPECPAAHSSWSDAAYQLNQALCCTDGLYESCYDIDCECYKGEDQRYCECGVFIPEQFDEEGVSALPLAYVGNMTGEPDQNYCLNFGGPILCPCRETCEVDGTTYFDSYTLNDKPPGSLTLTYGDLYCQAFKTRYILFPGVNTVLSMYQRAPQCPTVGWLEVPNIVHDERLCCNNDGEHVYPCDAEWLPLF